jgi:hypothetical protein
MPKTTTKPPTAPETPAPESQAPKPEPLRKQHYGQSLLGKVAILRLNASVHKTDDADLLDEIVTNAIEDHGISFREACWNALAKDIGLDFRWKSLKRRSEDINTLMRVLTDGSWFGQFLSTACYIIHPDKNRSLWPEDILEMVDEAHLDHLEQVENARAMLRKQPGLLIDDIRAAVSAHPELAEPQSAE